MDEAVTHVPFRNKSNVLLLQKLLKSDSNTSSFIFIGEHICDSITSNL